MTTAKAIWVLPILGCGLVLANCASEPQALTQLSTEPSGPVCPNGGTRLNAGLDENGDRQLTATEIKSSAVVCNGTDGNTLPAPVATSTHEPAGAICANGGIRFDVGIDANGNGVLDSSEIASTGYACTGATGATGTPGGAGEAGAKGANGTNGANGHNSLMMVLVESPGEQCPAGGARICVGVDRNDNGVLDDPEVDKIGYACNGRDGVCAGNHPPVYVSTTVPSETTFVVGTPFEVVINATDADVGTALTYQVFGSDFTITGSGTTFTLTPHQVGGPFYLGVLVSDGCELATGSFAINSVQPIPPN